MSSRIILTSDGSKTIYLPEMDEQYHSVNGALTESRYVYLEKGFCFSNASNPRVFEVGFGTGLNCLLTALEAESKKQKTNYISIEKFPLEPSIANELGYGRLISNDAQELFKEIHESPWNISVKINSYFNLFKLKADLLQYPLQEIDECDVIYFDAFGPDKQEEMWSEEIFKKIYALTASNGIFVTYSAKGVVRRQLTNCGFKMERLPGPPGKKQMLRGIKRDSSI